ncbi:putative glycosyltransferase [Abditibacteriota bacterium]|nr:putative glycosyltransferase [Abditibacteriota bacterium]
MSSAVAVSAVIPCLNEEETLAFCIRKAQNAFKKLNINGEVVVADNGSTDKSVEIAEQLGARVVHQSEKGYGAALKAGIEGAHGDVVVMGDADDSYDWESLGEFVHKIDEGNDLVMGNRFRGGIEAGAMPWHHRYIGNPVLSFVARVVCRAPIGDFHCGMRAFTKKGYEQMHLQTSGMEFASEMIISSARNGLRIAEIPTKLYPDKRSRPPHLRSFRDGWRHLKFILSYAPDHLLLAPGMLLFLPGLLLMLMLAAGPVTLGGFYMGAHFLALGCMLAMLGFNVLNLWMLGKRVVMRKHPKLSQTRVGQFVTHLTLERQLITGALLVLLGMGVDGAILLKWLAHPLASMESTVHVAFAASSCVEMGLTLAFSAFILNLVSSE